MLGNGGGVGCGDGALAAQVGQPPCARGGSAGDREEHRTRAAPVSAMPGAAAAAALADPQMRGSDVAEGVEGQMMEGGGTQRRAR